MFYQQKNSDSHSSVRNTPAREQGARKRAGVRHPATSTGETWLPLRTCLFIPLPFSFFSSVYSLFVPPLWPPFVTLEQRPVPPSSSRFTRLPSLFRVAFLFPPLLPSARSFAPSPSLNDTFCDTRHCFLSWPAEQRCSNDADTRTNPGFGF